MFDAPAPMTPAEFIAKWGPGGPAYALNEEQGAQSYFLDLCELLGVPKPGSGEVAHEYLFERGSLVLGEARGYADVFYRDHFAWENKAPGKNLDAALRQLQQYSLALANPPLLVVCDRLTIRIHTQFNGHPSQTHTVRLDQLDQPEARELLRRLWNDPASFRPQLTNRAITEAAAQSFATLAEQLRRRGHHPDAVAHFLTQCLFCFFAEDVGLLPGRMFERLVGNRHLSSERLTQGLQQLFATMRDGGLYGPDDLPWFNGGLFARIEVPRLEVPDVTELRKAAALNWSAIDVSIFGTLFERGLDPAKRSQLGAHYTDPATIARIIDPVIIRPLLQQWEQFAQELQGLTAKIKKHGDAAYQKAHARFVQWLQTLAGFRILDPACGSGNFLFLGLKALKDVELVCVTQAADLGLAREQDLVTGPHNVLGIELNEYAAELARVSIWIGEIQWRIAHGYQPKTNPVLEPLEQIECRDALLAWESEAQGGPPRPVEAAWPKADVVVGNPPFLGDKWMRSELGDAYVDALRKVYEGRVPGGADLVTFWYEKARSAIAQQALKAAGLVATNSIRQRGNRPVLERIAHTTRIFEAWADEPWVNEGAAVRVSIVCFGAWDQPARLDGQEVAQIFTDLKAQPLASGEAVDLTRAKPLAENADASYFGFCLAGKFKVPAETAAQWLRLPNVHGRPNSDVLKPIYNGRDITYRWSGDWVVDFGAQMSEQDAALYEAPFAHVRAQVAPVRASNKRAARARWWWRFGETRPGLRRQLAALTRYIVTVETAKHRLFVFLPARVAPEHRLIVIPRADDTTFGVLSSRFHVVWALARGGTLEDRPVYNTTQVFETFPFPAGLTPADTAHQRTEAVEGGALIPAGLADTVLIAAQDFEPNRPQAKAQQALAATKSISLRAAATAIAQAAQRLDALRQAWLNPPEWTQRVPEVVPLGMEHSPYPERIVPRPGFEKDLQQRTLTKLYNQRPAWLAQAHAALDAAVAAAYGWADYAPDWSDEDILRRLLALNLARSHGAGPAGGAA
ncbi:class I SAM-dependent DNA methyltransferase [Extensimonas perlucida]|uniref:class I SAM-dependent DNA methyltransferase n=1 Tax=Extensimonas perlucida TaxID=2590786 RepID=UPI0011A2ECE9|nr:DNA methyltransferase [Extensimonas perlucida]